MRRRVYTWFDGRWYEEGASEMGSVTARGRVMADLRSVSPGRFDVSGAARGAAQTCNGYPNLYARV